MKKKVLLFIAIVVVLFGAMFGAIYFASKSSKTETNEGSEVSSTTVEATDPGNRTEAYLNKDAKLSDIKKETGVVNVYMFWGNGCPHCKAQWEYLEAMRKEYPNDFNVYGFEVWYSKENMALMEEFMAAAGDSDVNSVPYTIIGEKSFVGAQNEKTLVETIKAQKDKGVDVYFDKIRK